MTVVLRLRIPKKKSHWNSLLWNTEDGLISFEREDRVLLRDRIWRIRSHRELWGCPAPGTEMSGTLLVTVKVTVEITCKSFLWCHKPHSSLSVQRVRPYVAILWQGSSFPSICIQPRCFYSLPSSVKLRHLFYDGRKKKKCVWSIHFENCLSLGERSTGSSVTLDGPQLCGASSKAAFPPTPRPTPKALPRACAFKPLPVDFTRAHFLPVLKALPHHICEGFVLEQAKQSWFPPPLICQ